MKVIQVNDNDLNGRIYNGHDLQLSLNELGIEAHQLVAEKFGTECTTIPILSKYELDVRRQLTEFEKKIGMLNLLEPFSNKIMESKYFKEADIVHYHIIHNQVISLLDLPQLMKSKPSVWTIHDPWIIGGHCIYPLSCERWKTGCNECNYLERPFTMQIDKAHDLWKIKQKIYSEMDLDIVVSSDWMKDYLIKSPLTSDFTRIHKIPFGIKLEKYELPEKERIRKKLNIALKDVVISFRADTHIVKGMNYIIEALQQLDTTENITILTVGTAKLPEVIINRYNTIELGWQREEGVIDCLIATDIFLMPSLAESFGLMAIEAMAAKCAVIVFSGTVLEKVTFAPECGVAVPLKNAEALSASIKHLIENQNELLWRCQEGYNIVKKYYMYSSYVQKHIDLYEEILERKTDNNYAIFFDGNIVSTKNENQEVVSQLVQIKKFKDRLKAFSYNKANKVCIFCAGNYGRELYFNLKDRMISVEYIVDNDESKWGYLLLGNDSKGMMEAGVEEYVTRAVDYAPMPTLVECVGIERLLRDKDDTLVIVANKYSDTIVKDLQMKGFPFVITKQDVDEMIENVPRADIFGLGKFYGNKLTELSNLNYSDIGVQRLVTSFNRIISGVCRYYEDKM